MMKFIAFLLAVIAIVASAVLASPNYGSYITFCTPTEVHFHNFKQQNCAGNFTIYTKPLGGCRTEPGPGGKTYSWNGMCNTTIMQYYNYNGLQCQGPSILTRTYKMNECFNCPNPECKNP